MTTVVNKHRLSPGWERDPRYVYVGRPSKWCNPASHLPSQIAEVRVGSREAACNYFERVYLPAHPELVAAAKVELADKFLVCFCAPKRCHADAWARIANGGVL